MYNKLDIRYKKTLSNGIPYVTYLNQLRNTV